MRSSGSADEVKTSPAFYAAADGMGDGADPEDQDDGDIRSGIDEESLDADELDTDVVSSPAPSPLT